MVRCFRLLGLCSDRLWSTFLDIHPLALEDVLHQRGKQARSKADYYLRHLFIRILRHTLGSDDEDSSKRETIAPSITRLPRSSSPDVIGGESDDDIISSSVEWGDNKTLSASPSLSKRRGSMGKAGMNGVAGDLEKGHQDVSRGRGRTTSALSRVRQNFLLLCAGI